MDLVDPLLLDIILLLCCSILTHLWSLKVTDLDFML